MNTYALDWGEKYIAVHDPKGMLSETYPTLFGLLDALQEPSRLIIEATFGSFALTLREKFIERCLNNGHELWTVPTRLTARLRKQSGVDKSDKVDAGMIFRLGQTDAKRRYRKPDQRLVKKRVKANDLLMRMRRESIEVRPKQQRLDGHIEPKLVKMKDIFAEQIEKRIIRWRYIPNMTPRICREAFEAPNKGGYNPVTLAALGVAALFTDSIREFESIAGLSANGYPGQIRADLFHWNWSGGAKRPKLKKIGSFKDKDGESRHIYGGRKDGLKMSDWRRSVRWLFRQVKPVAKEAYEATRAEEGW